MNIVNCLNMSLAFLLWQVTKASMTNFVLLASKLFDTETRAKTLSDSDNAIYAISQETFISQLQFQSNELILRHDNSVTFKVSFIRFHMQ